MGLPLVGRDVELARTAACLRGGGALVLSGPSGVGRTRMLREAERIAASEGLAVESIAGSVTARHLPLGAAAHLVPAGPDRTPHARIAAALGTLEERARRTGVVLLVDDADLLDPATATLVQHVVRSAVVTTVVTARSDVPSVPDVVVSLWSDLGAERVGLTPLERADHERLLELALGGAIGADLEGHVWELTAGSPLLLREALAAAEEAGAFARDDTDVWRLRGHIPATERVVEIVRVALSAFPSELADAIDELAHAEPAPTRAAAEVLGRHRLQALDDLGVITIDDATTVPTVRLRYPMWGSALRSATTLATSPGRAQAWSDAILATSDQPHDRLRAATLLLEAGQPLAPDLALEAAGTAVARFDGATAERLILHGIETDGLSATAAVTLGQAQQLQGRPAEADATLRHAAEHATDEPVRTEATLARARNLHWILGDRARALDVLATAAERAGSEASRGAFEIESALYHAVVGDLLNAGAVAARALERGALDPAVELNGLVVLTLAQCVQGQLGEFRARRDRALRLARDHRAQQPLAEGQVLLNEAHLLLFHDLAATEAMSSRAASTPSPLTGMWQATTGMCHLAAGAVGDAARVLRDAAHHLEQVDPFGNLHMVRAMQALGCLRSGDPDEAGRVLETIDEQVAAAEPRTRVWHRRAVALELVSRGEHEAGRDLVHLAGRDALDAGYASWGALALHDAAVLGAVDAAPALRQVADRTDVHGLELFARHARARADGDADALDSVAHDLLTAGRALDAAEAFAAAAAATPGDDGDARGRRLLRAAALAQRCQDAWVVTLAPFEVAISAREVEIAHLVSAGAANREVAGALFLSHRTVENHLARLYRRFGLDGRDALREALEPMPTPTTQPDG